MGLKYPSPGNWRGVLILREIIWKLTYKRDSVTYDDLVDILKDSSIDKELFKAADEVRERYLGKEVFLRGIIEFSNFCRRNCLYCGLRAPNFHLSRYRMTKEEILKRVKVIYEKGIRTVVLQSGEDPFYMPDLIADIVYEIKKQYDVAVTLSLGEWPKEFYKLWKEAGADRYLMRHETASEEIYAKLHPGHTFGERARKLLELKELGYEIGAGCMVGLPQQDAEKLALDLIFMREIDTDMAGIGPFIPHPDTPLAREKGGDLRTSLKMLALTRLLIPTCNIPATTAMRAIHPRGRELALKCGANVIMPNMTPSPYRAKYQLYPGKICIFEKDDTICASCTVNLIRSIGRIPSRSKGFRVRRDKRELVHVEHSSDEQGKRLQNRE